MAIPTRTPTAVTPPLPVGSSATLSIGSKAHKHQVMQDKLDIAKKCRAAMCKPNNTNQPTDPLRLPHRRARARQLGRDGIEASNAPCQHEARRGLSHSVASRGRRRCARERRRLGSFDLC